MLFGAAPCLWPPTAPWLFGGILPFFGGDFCEAAPAAFFLGEGVAVVAGVVADDEVRVGTVTQLTGHCAPNAGIYVNDQRVPLVYCMSESDNEPLDCPDAP